MKTNVIHENQKWARLNVRGRALINSTSCNKNFAHAMHASPWKCILKDAPLQLYHRRGPPVAIYLHSSSTTCSKESKCGHIKRDRYIETYTQAQNNYRTVLEAPPPGLKNNHFSVKWIHVHECVHIIILIGVCMHRISSYKRLGVYFLESIKVRLKIFKKKRKPLPFPLFCLLIRKFLYGSCSDRTQKEK